MHKTLFRVDSFTTKRRGKKNERTNERKKRGVQHTQTRPGESPGAVGRGRVMESYFFAIIMFFFFFFFTFLSFLFHLE
jgi:hypothetical protein